MLKKILMAGLLSLIADLSADAQSKPAAVYEPVLAQASYDFPAPNAPRVIDSIRYFYNGVRSSKYDFLHYSFNNDNDVPGVKFSDHYVNFDSALYFHIQNGTGPLKPNGNGRRVYDAQDNILWARYGVDSQNFMYNSGKLQQLYSLNTYFGTAYQSTTSYMYGSNGFLKSGSDGKQYHNYMTNAAGQITLDSVETVTMTGGRQPYYKIIFTYINGLPTTEEQQNWDFTTGAYKKFTADSFGYSGQMWNWAADYEWINGVRTQVSIVLRHLNAAGMPDSIWVKNLGVGSTSSDSTIYKLTYNSNNNPTSFNTFSGKNVPIAEVHYYYKITPPAPAGMANHASLAAVEVFPNPATGYITVRGCASESIYSILNSTGALVMSGKITQSGSIDINYLPAGPYLIRLTDASGARFVKAFVKN